MSRDFSTWLSGFRDSIADYGYYIDFEKVYCNVDRVRLELHLLNSLIGSKKHCRGLSDVSFEISRNTEMYSVASGCKRE
mgnify:CR=1 FL=1